MSKQDYYAQVTKTNLERISNWAIQWKMNFNLDTTKQAQEVVFSRKVKKKNSSSSILFMLVLLGHLPKNTWESYLTIG